MQNSPLSLEIAHELIRERLQEAAHDALLERLSASASATSRSAPGGTIRLSLAAALRALAIRLDPSSAAESLVGRTSGPTGEPCLAVLPTTRRTPWKSF